MQLTLALAPRQVLPGPSPLGELDQRRQETGKRLAAASGRDQERTAAISCQADQGKLVLPGRPAAALEPA